MIDVYTREDSVWRPTSQETSYSDNDDTAERRGHHISRSISQSRVLNTATRQLTTISWQLHVIAPVNILS